MEKLVAIINNIFTARDNQSVSLTKLVGIGAAITMCYKFATGDSADYSGFGTGIALLMTALAAKYMAEKE